MAVLRELDKRSKLGIQETRCARVEKLTRASDRMRSSAACRRARVPANAKASISSCFIFSSRLRRNTCCALRFCSARLSLLLVSASFLPY